MSDETTPEQQPPTTYSPSLAPPAVVAGTGEVPPASAGSVADVTTPAPTQQYPAATNGQGAHPQQDRAPVPYVQPRPAPLSPEWFALRRARARKVRRTIRHIDPWSVFKVSVLIYFCLYIAVLLSGVLLWSAAVGSGLIANVESFIEELLTFESYEFQADEIFRGFAIIGLVLAAAGAAFNVVMAVLFNLISDLTGGIRVTVLEEDDAVPLAQKAAKPVRQPRPKKVRPPKPAAAPKERSAHTVPPIPDQSDGPPVAPPAPTYQPVAAPPLRDDRPADADQVANQSPVS